MGQLKKRILHVMERVAPKATQVIQVVRARRYVNRLQEESGLAALTENAVTQLGGRRVLAGPFAGLQFEERTTWSCLVAKLVGAYEAEVIAELELLLSPPHRDEYDLAIDVGCADGYYAIGLARRLPRAKTIAYDLDPLARKVVRQMATRNGVSERVTVSAACTPEELQGRLNACERALIVCDCEGYEDVLLDPAQVPALAKADLLVEFHDGIVPGVSQRVCDRLSVSHHVKIIHPAPRRVEDFPAMKTLPAKDAARLLDEMRGTSQCWGAFVHK